MANCWWCSGKGMVRGAFDKDKLTKICAHCKGTGKQSDEPRTRPIQGGWLEKDTLTGEVREPTLKRREES